MTKYDEYIKPKAIKVEPLENYKLMVTFQDGKVGIFDVKPYLFGEFYEPIKDREYFKKVKINGFTVEWPNGADISPEELYENSIRV